MAWVAALLLCLAAGWFLARALTAGAWATTQSAPRWMSALVEAALAVLIGPGLASIFYVAMVTAGAASPGKVLAMLGVYTAACAGIWWRVTPSVLPPAAVGRKLRWAWALWIAVGVGLLCFLLDNQAASSANPNGEWDAMAIWNLRAHDLAAGGNLWRRAVSTSLNGVGTGTPHPGYPLFLSGFIGLQWSAGGGIEPVVPIAASLIIASAGFLLLGSSLMCRRSKALGLLAWLALLASEVYASQTASQYSDLLLGLAFLSALVLLDAAAGVSKRGQDSARLLIAAGLAIGLAGWIKNEGLPFALAALAVGWWRFRGRAFGWMLLGAAPGLLATAVLKLFLVQGRDAVFPATITEAISKITSAGRWWQAALGFGRAVYDAGSPWTHPVVLMAVLALALGFVPKSKRRARLWLWIPIAVAVVAEYAIYLMATADLNWQISTSVNRLLAQLWPSLIWLVFLLLRAPEDFFEAAAAGVPSKAPRGAAKAQAKAKRR